MTETKEAPSSATPSHTITTLIPHLTCGNAAEAVKFYQKALGATVEGEYALPNGKIMHAALKVAEATFFVVDEFPDFGSLGPIAIGGSPVTLHLHVPDCDAVFKRAVDAGCEVLMPLDDMFWGDRWGLLKDPFGHKWGIASTVREVSPAELQAAISNMGGCGDN